MNLRTSLLIAVAPLAVIFGPTSVGAAVGCDGIAVEEPTPIQLALWMKHQHDKGGVSIPQKITKTVSGVTFDSDYDNGSLLNVVAGANANAFTCSIFEEQGVIGPRKYWFRFTMEGAAGRTVTLSIDHSNSLRPWYRFDGGTWTQMTSAQAPTSQSIVLAIPADSQIAELAFYSPIGYQETLDQVNALIANRHDASMSVIGQSTQGRDVHMITINDSTYPDPGKQRIWMHTRAHAGEVTSTHSMLGFLEQVLEDSDTGRRLRQNGIYHIVPQLNVDGIWLGHTRWTSQGIDPEREWCGVVIPEVQAMKTQIDAFMATANPLKVALNMHSTVGTWQDTFFFNHQPNSVTTAYSNYQRAYIQALRAATDAFDNRNPQTSNLAACVFVESYFYNNWSGAVMAMTHEGHYSRRFWDNAFATDEDHREVGRGMARALFSFLSYPELIPEWSTNWVMK